MEINIIKAQHALNLLAEVPTHQEQEVQKLITRHPQHNSEDIEHSKCSVLNFSQLTKRSLAFFE